MCVNRWVSGRLSPETDAGEIACVYSYTKQALCGAKELLKIRVKGCIIGGIMKQMGNPQYVIATEQRQRVTVSIQLNPFEWE